jgi:penicillin-binding protein 2
MYHHRLKIFILLCLGGLAVAVGRLVILQTFQSQQARRQVDQLRILGPQQRPTIRGRILDRHETPLALDKPAFFLHINYELTRMMDPRWREGKIRRAVTQEKTRPQVEQEFYNRDWKSSLEALNKTIELTWQLADVSRDEIVQSIQQINDFIWERARYIQWLRGNQGRSRSEYLAERDSILPEQIAGIDLWEMHQSYPLIELKTPNDLLRAQIELLNLKELEIKSEAKRSYPYGSAGCQIIGWVAPWQENEIEMFEHDNYMSYQEGEVIGKSGIEKVCEPALRGRRGEVRYDREGNLLQRKDPQYGRDIQLTIDIELQQKIENLLADKTMPHEGKPGAAVVLEAANNDILAIVSTPVFDLNTIRQRENYNRIFNPRDPNKLWENKALERNYPPGSTAKPLVLIAGLEEHKIGPLEPISCSSWKMPPEGWPRCLLQRIGTSHDVHFGEGGNYARNAIRGSCNVYFSQLANRLNGQTLQSWLFRFGFGQDVLPPLLPQSASLNDTAPGTLSQSRGCLVYDHYQPKVKDASELKPIPDWEKKWWGMGQGSLRVTVLQAANALSAVARDGIYKAPRLVFDDTDPCNERYSRKIPVSASPLAVVRDGMKAVVYESHGTAHDEFKNSELFDRDITLYGKTGSTERPYHAWFECFAEDSSGRTLIVAVLVEGGQRGAGEAAPLGHQILRYCNEAGYIGKKPIAAPPAESQAVGD